MHLFYSMSESCVLLKARNISIFHRSFAFSFNEKEVLYPMSRRQFSACLKSVQGIMNEECMMSYTYMSKQTSHAKSSLEEKRIYLLVH